MSSFTTGVRNQTKERFDTLLKAALRKKSQTKSKQNLVEENSDGEEFEDKAYIMDKFLHDTTQKTPIPKPRRRILETKSSESNSVVSPKQSSSEISTSEKHSRKIKDVSVCSENEVINLVSPKQSTSSEKSKSDKHAIKSKDDSISMNDDMRSKVSHESDISIEKHERKHNQYVSAKREVRINQESNVVVNHPIPKTRVKLKKPIETNDSTDDDVRPEPKVRHSKKNKNGADSLDTITQEGDIKYENEIKPKQRKLKMKEEVPKPRKKKTSTVEFKYEQILNVYIHRTDRLKLESYVIHPVVKIHLVDATTGEYLKKSNKTRAALFYHERKDIDYIGPIMTRAYNLQENRSLHPNWEENIVINEDVEYLTSIKDAVILFEIVDFSTKEGHLGWYRIAWAFLKLLPINQLSIERSVRLQLFSPKKMKIDNPNQCEIYDLWSKRKCLKYPSTLHVTIKSAAMPKEITTSRSSNPYEKEIGKSQLIDENQITTSSVTWDKLEHQFCKVPNMLVGKIGTGEDGCFLMEFSTSGNYLAYSSLDDNIYNIVIYSITEMAEVARLPSHQGLIYCMIWSPNDKFLISASADCTVSIWDIDTRTFLQMLPHPAFVYTCCLSGSSIATGCFDKYLRIWCLEKDGKYKLHEEFQRHQGYVTSICSNKLGNVLYSSDSMGSIFIWVMAEGDWKFLREILVLDLQDIAINQIVLHRRGKRLFVNSRDDKVRMIDIKTGYVLQTYYGSINNRLHINISISENYVFSGSECGELFVWNAENGTIEDTWKPFEKDVVIHCAASHPKENYLAISHYGLQLPILLYRHEENIKTIKYTNNEATDLRQYENKFKSLDFKGILEKMDTIMNFSKY